MGNKGQKIVENPILKTLANFRGVLIFYVSFLGLLGCYSCKSQKDGKKELKFEKKKINKLFKFNFTFFLVLIVLNLACNYVGSCKSRHNSLPVILFVP